MSPSPGKIKGQLIIFVFGISFGFCLTYFLFTSRGQTFSVNYAQQFIPSDPHSHGQMDSFVGPAKAQDWNDFDEENHRDEGKQAEKLRNKVKVLCWVMTNPSNIDTKAKHVKATWGKRCNILLFMSSVDEPSLPAIGLNTSEGRDFLWGKTRAAFKYIYDHHFKDADWFLKADDDTYVILENLRRLLQDYPPNKPLYFGRRFKPYTKQGYMSGGAGYVLSREGVKRFVEQALNDPNKCRQDPGGAEDVEMGRCVENMGIIARDSRDSLGRETFNPFIPEHHLIPGLIGDDNWLWSYNYYSYKQGPECCSDYAISFHYIPPNMMYVLEYLIYHLKPYGISSKIVLPARTEKNQPHSQNIQEVPKLSKFKSKRKIMPKSKLGAAK